MKLDVVVTHQESVVIDIGDLPEALARELLIDVGNGKFGSWSMGDFAGSDWEVVDVKVTEAK